MMGISFNNSVFTITNSAGNTKFSLDKRLPHIIHNFSGTITVPKIINADNFNDTIIDRVDTVSVLSNLYISSAIEDNFILPFFKITGGVSDTGTNIVSGVGSTIVRKIFQPSTREFFGSSIIDVVAENSELKIVCNHHMDRTGSINIDGDTDVTIQYRIYYGRFN